MTDVTEENLHCKVFVGCDLEAESVLEMIAGISSASVDQLTVATDWGEVDVVENDEFDAVRRKDRGGFVFYKLCLDIEPATSTARTRYVEGVALLLELLWDSGYRAVAACDFEEDLPRKGGYGFDENG